MSKPTVVIHNATVGPAMDIVREAHPDLDVIGCESHARLPELIRETGANVLYSIRFTDEVPYPGAALTDNGILEWISVGGSGTDHLPPWDAEELTVTNSAGVAADMMAEYALGAMLSFSLDLRGFRAAQAKRRWMIDGSVQPIEGKTILIIGLGKTGQALARRCKAMGLRVLGVRARPAPTTDVDETHGMDALPDLVPQSDFVTLAVPLLASTRGLFNAGLVDRMHPRSVLIDVSRGGVCDQDALARALAGDRIRGAALDVFETEPLPPDSPFWDLENVILTPHCSSVYDGWSEKSARMFTENLTRFRKGEALTNIVDPGRGY